jgi:hypothetical protein
MNPKTEDQAVNQIIESQAVVAPRVVDRYLLLVRYGVDYWSASGSAHATAEAAAKAAANDPNITPWRIVVVRDLPVERPTGEAS